MIVVLIVGGSIAGLTIYFNNVASDGLANAPVTTSHTSLGLLAAILSLPLLFVLLFLAMFVSGHLAVARAKRTFQNGKVALATVADTSMRVNGRPRMVPAFHFTDEAGRSHVITHNNSKLTPPISHNVYAIYDPRAPDKALLWPF